MNEYTNTEKLTREDETRANKIALIVAKLPEREQEKIYYMIQGHYTLKGIELKGNTNAFRAAI